MSTLSASLERALEEHRAGRLGPAEEAYRTLLESEPQNAAARHLLGLALLQQGDALAALPLLEQAAASAPGNADYQNRLGAALLALGRRDEAAAAFRHALAATPGHPEALNNLANLFADAGDHAGAVETYRQALAGGGGFASAHNGLAVALAALGRYDEAEHHFRRAIDLQPAYAEARCNYANFLLGLGRATDALAQLNAAADSQSNDLRIPILLAQALAQTGAIRAARDAATTAIDLAPDDPRAHNCYGMICRLTGDPARALLHFDRAIEVDPDFADGHGNRAQALLALGRAADGEAAAATAAELAPGSAVHRMNLGMIRLLRGDFRHGFADYRARFDAGLPWVRRRRFAAPAWDGGAVDGATALVWGEQGVGEEIMFASLLPRLRPRLARCLLECDPRLVPLFARSFPDVEVVERRDPADPRLDDPAIELAIAAGDLALALGLEPDDLGPPAAFLVAEAKRVKAVRRRLDGRGPGAKVGIAWRSRGPHVAFSSEKSSTLDDWDAVLRVPGVAFTDLQHGDTRAEAAAVARRLGVAVSRDPAIDQTTDLDGFAAQIAALDLVITTSNTTAHLAGALGKEAWVVLPHVPDWRWQLDRADCLWYPGARLFRQPSPGDWRGALAAVAAALAQRIGG